jgi:Cu(I)-responsive transcriptional regulator
MNIGQAAIASGISAKMIRYYESIELIPAPGRSESGYRHYGPPEIHRLQFIRRARDLGFGFNQVRELLKLWTDQQRSSADVKALALAQIDHLEVRARELQQMLKVLHDLVELCDGDNRPNCPIIEELGSDVCPTCTKPQARARKRGIAI